MKIVEFGGQVQCRLEDGAVVVITTPTLVPHGSLTVDEVREALMSLGEDVTQVKNKSHILPATRIPGNLRLRTDD